MGPGLHRDLAGHHGLARRRNLDRLLPRLGYDVTTWDGFEVLRDIRELRMTTMAARIGEQDPATRGQFAHRLVCLQGRNGPRPWDGWRTVP